MICLKSARFSSPGRIVIERVAPASGWTGAAGTGAGGRVATRAPAPAPVPAVGQTVIEPPPRQASTGFLAQLLAQADGEAPAAPAPRPREAAARYAAPTRVVRRLGWMDV
jgi:hypothetical protein